MRPRRARLLLLDGNSRFVGDALSTPSDEREEPDPPADTRLLAPAIAIVGVRSGGTRSTGPFQALIAKSA